MAPVAALISAAAFFWFAGLIHFRDAMLGPLPSPGMFADVGRGIARAIRASTTEVAPVHATPQLLTLITMIVWAAAWLVDDAIHKLRHPLLAIGFVMPVFVFPATLLSSPRRWLDTALFIAASLAVMFGDESSRLARWGRQAGTGTPGWRAGLAAKTGGLITVAAILLAPLVPGYGAEPGFGGDGAGFGEGDRVAINPLVEIQPNLNRTPAAELFTVRASEPGYWRLTALDQFSGAAWSAPTRRATPRISGRTVPPSSPDSPAKVLQQEITIKGLAGPWLPGAYESLRVDGRPGVRLEPITRSLVLADALRTGQRVSITSRVPAPTPEALDEITADRLFNDAVGSQFLSLPAGSGDGRIAEYTRQVTDGADTPFRKAVALQQHFLDNFVYNDQVGRGHSFRSISEFLFDVREGYCEQFAGSMAVMARIIGIPSRVAIGFASGDQIAPGVFRVTTKHAHAWVELYFPGYGWLPFEPTPRSEVTSLPPYTTPAALDPTATPTASPQPSVRPSVSPTASVDPRLGREEGGPTTTAPVRGGNRTKLWIVLAVVLAFFAGLPGGAALKRAFRRRKAAGPRGLAVSHYMDFVDWCASARLPKRPGETPAEYAARLAAQAAPAEGPLKDLAALTTRTLWAPDGAADPGRAAALGKQARKAIATTLPPRSRAMSAVGWGWWKR